MESESLRMLGTVMTSIMVPVRSIFMGLFYVLRWLLTPLLLLSRLAVALSVLPIQFFAQFEAFFIFFGVATGVGIALGLCLHLLLRRAAQVFDLDRQMPDRVSKENSSGKASGAAGHSAASYRAALGKKRLVEAQRRAARARAFASNPWLRPASSGRENRTGGATHLNPVSPRQRAGLLSTTILEEVDDSDDGYGF